MTGYEPAALTILPSVLDKEKTKIKFILNVFKKKKK
jgi:hypothetical protein